MNGSTLDAIVRAVETLTEAEREALFRRLTAQRKATAPKPAGERRAPGKVTRPTVVTSRIEWV